jgi:tetratricopeptide (TPR) repeat protein
LGCSRASSARRSALEDVMGTGAITIVLIFLLLFLSWQTIYSANRDLARAKAWGDLLRRALPFFALLLMVSSLFLVQSFGQGWTLLAWMAVAGVAIIGASLLSVSSVERRANKAFRSGDYATAVELYEKLVEEKPLARNKAFLGAALGAAERNEESVDLSTQAIEQDPKYGLAYYNRALVLQRMGKKSRAVKDLNQALEADLPRRFRSAARRMLEEIS